MTGSDNKKKLRRIIDLNNTVNKAHTEFNDFIHSYSDTTDLRNYRWEARRDGCIRRLTIQTITRDTEGQPKVAEMRWKSLGLSLWKFSGDKWRKILGNV